MIASLNQAVVTLGIFAVNPNGSIKTNVVSGTVRVYSVAAGGTETNILASTALEEASSGKWRYVWSPTTLAVGQYIIEYDLIDTDTIQTRVGEDLIVRDIASQTDLLIIKAIQTGRWRIYLNQLFLYGTDGVTVTHLFNLKDADGNPATNNVTERVPVP